MKTIVTLLLTVGLLAALLTGCTASARGAADIETGPAYAEPTQQSEPLAKAHSEPYGQKADAEVATNVPVEQMVSTISAVYQDLCAVCTDPDCDGGKHCNNGEEWVENRSCSTPCKACGEDTCDGGINCSGRNSRHNSHHGNHHGNHK